MSLYHVRIELREPGFELRIGPRAEPFLAGYDITADTREQAARLAVEKLNHDAAMSGVGWSRVVERVLVGPEPVPQEAWDPESVGPRATEPPAEPAPIAPRSTFAPEPPTEASAPSSVIASERVTDTEPALPTEQAVWNALQTLAVIAGVGLGFYLGVKAARWRDAA